MYIKEPSDLEMNKPLKTYLWYTGFGVFGLACLVAFVNVLELSNTVPEPRFWMYLGGSTVVALGTAIGLLTSRHLANIWLLVSWVFGFFALLLFDLFVEFLVFPRIGLDNTPRNDWFFIGWWIMVWLWFFFGRQYIQWRNRRRVLQVH